MSRSDPGLSAPSPHVAVPDSAPGSDRRRVSQLTRASEISSLYHRLRRASPPCPLKGRFARSIPSHGVPRSCRHPPRAAAGARQRGTQTPSLQPRPREFETRVFLIAAQRDFFVALARFHLTRVAPGRTCPAVPSRFLRRSRALCPLTKHPHYPPPGMRRLRNEKPAVGICVLRHFHVPRVLGHPPRPRRAHQLRQVRVFSRSARVPHPWLHLIKKTLDHPRS